MPPDIEDKAERAGKAILFGVQGVLLATLSILAWSSCLTLETLEFRSDGWRQAFTPGILAGSGWLTSYLVVLVVFRPTAVHFARHLPARSDFSFWLALSLSSAFVEEIWRAFCLVALAAQGNVVATIVTTGTFGLAHARPCGRAISATLFAIYAAWLFLTVKSLWATVFTHALVNIGVFFLIRLSTPAGARSNAVI